MTNTQAAGFLSELSSNGYCVIPDVLDGVMLQRLQARFGDDSLRETANSNFGEAGAFIVANYHDPIMVDLLTWPKTMGLFSAWGYTDPRLHNFYVSTKPPGAKALPWHSDLFYEYEGADPTELFLIYYIQDTVVENGCLRVVPGSHRWSYTERHAQPENSDTRSDEVDVPIKAGSLFVGDRRIMHATYANSGSAWRTCLTIAYAPQFNKLSDSVKALIIKNQCLPPPEWYNSPERYEIDPRLIVILPI